MSKVELLQNVGTPRHVPPMALAALKSLRTNVVLLVDVEHRSDLVVDPREMELPGITALIHTDKLDFPYSHGHPQKEPVSEVPVTERLLAAHQRRRRWLVPQTISLECKEKNSQY